MTNIMILLPTLHFAFTMMITSNKLPPYDTNSIVPANNSYFHFPLGHIPVVINHTQVVVTKKQGDEGSKQFTLNYFSVTKALNPGFGVAKCCFCRN